MSYSKTTWKTGDTITAQLLNHAEDGIAANDAAIAAIPAGVQLYGPYGASASNPSEIAAGEEGFVTCDTLEDKNGATVVYPATEAKLFIESVATGATGRAKALLGAISLPSYSGGQWSDSTVNLINMEASGKKFYPNIGFYSTVEFPQES